MTFYGTCTRVRWQPARGESNVQTSLTGTIYRYLPTKMYPSLSGRKGRSTTVLRDLGRQAAERLTDSTASRCQGNTQRSSIALIRPPCHHPPGVYVLASMDWPIEGLPAKALFHVPVPLPKRRQVVCLNHQIITNEMGLTYVHATGSKKRDI